MSGTAVRTVRPVKLPFGTAVAGVSFRQGALREVVEGDRLEVVAADDNPHDADACEVRTTSGTMLGFIPKALAGRLRATGEGPWPATVDEVLRRETWGLRITVRPPETGGTANAADPPADADAKADGEGLDGFALQQPAGPGDDSSQDPQPEEVTREVRAASGRPLGRFLRFDGTKVVVDAGGREISYPASVVVIEVTG